VGSESAAKVLSRVGRTAIRRLCEPILILN
jgi:hypothetical protein